MFLKNMVSVARRSMCVSRLRYIKRILNGAIARQGHSTHDSSLLNQANIVPVVQFGEGRAIAYTPLSPDQAGCPCSLYATTKAKHDHRNILITPTTSPRHHNHSSHHPIPRRCRSHKYLPGLLSITPTRRTRRRLLLRRRHRFLLRLLLLLLRPRLASSEHRRCTHGINVEVHAPHVAWIHGRVVRDVVVPCALSYKSARHCRRKWLGRKSTHPIDIPTQPLHPHEIATLAKHLRERTRRPTNILLTRIWTRVARRETCPLGHGLVEKTSHTCRK